ncbi:Indigoidine synthase A-like protein [Mycena chlorophos]|uniref:Indigoidine synthase A-like protein n=1 Tax=Mycena chlorophos TaxID=658473 RepID=A0A8H6T4H4_MYCCL|nr:Indigoidine synthase A-like protein [Mycena chlorophos]
MLLSRVPRRSRVGCRGASIARLSTAWARGAPIDIHPEVQEALATGKPVVALETALTTHGLPPPINLQTTLALENTVRSTGCVPATIGIVAGRVKIGLERPEIERLADVDRVPRSVKISRRDISSALALKVDGGTTIAATLIFAALAGIKVFATGGLGGVHRGGENSLDISADLQELTRCPVGLVSAGVKSILDIERTLEYMETLGVPVLSYSKTKDFPAFFTPRSGFQTPWNTDDPRVAAEILHTQAQLGMQHGVLFAAPIPEEYAERGQVFQEAVDQAVRESEINGMSKRGKDVTPWLLGRVAELTQRGSIEANIALLENSALIGGQIAAQYQQLISAMQPEVAHWQANRLSALPPSAEGGSRIIVAGSAAIDITAQGPKASGSTGSTFPGHVKFGLGGVARNMAEACHRLGGQPILVAPIGDDAWGSLLRDQTAAMGMATTGFIAHKGERTAVCNLFLEEDGELIAGVADMDITQNLDPRLVIAEIEARPPSLLALDGNLSADAIRTLVDFCTEAQIPVLFEPTSIPKSTRIIPAIAHCLERSAETPISFFTPNIAELKHATLDDNSITSTDAWWSAIDRMSLSETFRADLDRLSRRPVRDDGDASKTLDFLVTDGIAQMAIQLTPFFRHMFIKCGENGVFAVLKLAGTDASGWQGVRSDPERRYVVARGDLPTEVLVLQHFPSFPTAVLNTTGAGDSLVGSLLAGLVSSPSPLANHTLLAQLVERSQRAASLSLQSQFSVSPDLNTLQ